MKKLCAFILSMCMLFSYCYGGQPLLPSYASLLTVMAPSIRYFTDSEPVSDITLEDGSHELVFEGISQSIYEKYSEYLSDCGCLLDSYSIEKSILTATIVKDGVCFSFIYDAISERATFIYPPNVAEEDILSKNGDVAEVFKDNAGSDSDVINSELRSATIRTIGDFVIHDVVFNSAKRMGTSTMQYDFAPMLSYVKNYIANADFTVANVDGCLGGKDVFKYGYSGYPQLNTPEHILYALKDCGVDMLTLANNHMLDGWFSGLQKTIDNVEAAGFYHVGANRSQEEKNSPYIVEINGIRVGFMNYTVSLNTMDTQSGLDKRAMEFGVNATKNSDAAADAARLRSAGAEVIVCFMHWGEEYKSTPDSNQEFLASNLVRAGVDVIMGGHPHQVQPAKWLSGTNQFGENQKTLCVYSIGNFLSDQRGEATSGGIMYDFTIQEKADGSFEITSPAYLPVWVWRTGTGDNDRNYYVLPTQDYLKTRPAGMSDSDYELMISNYNSIIDVMQKGVGNLISR